MLWDMDVLGYEMAEIPVWGWSPTEKRILSAEIFMLIL